MKKLWITLFTALAVSSAMASNIKWSSPPATLSTTNQNASDPQIASDGNGELVAAWIENGIVKASIKPTNMGWGPLATLSGSNSSSPSVVSDGTDRFTAVWNEGGLIKTATRPAGGNWGGTTTLSGSGSSSPALAVDTAGNMVAVWVASNGVIRSSTKLAGGNWSGSAAISTNAGTLPFIAMGGSSSSATSVVVWQGTSSGANVVFASSKLTSGSWGTQVVISDTTHSAGYAHIAVDGNANATAVWYKYDVAGTNFSNVTVSSATKVAGGSWGASVGVSSPGRRDPSTLIARVGYDKLGNAIALWNNSYDVATFNIESAVKPVGGVWSSPILALEENDYAYEVDLAVCPLGNAHSTYMFFNGQYLLIRSAENDITGFMPSMWSVPLNIGVGAENGFPRIAAVLTDNTINTGALWLTQNGTHQNVVAVTGTKDLVGAPASLSVTQSANDFGVFSEYQNTVSWTASTDDNAAGYLIYRNGVFIGRLDDPTATEFVDHNMKQSAAVTYGVATVDYQQSHSKIVTVSYP